MNSDEVFIPPKVPGHFQISNDAYHAGPGVSSSGLKLLQVSPAHYWARYIDPEREPSRSTPALATGNIIHKAVLEPDDYFKGFYPLPEKFDRRTKEGKASYEYHEQRAQELGQMIISADDHRIAQAIAQNVRESEAADFLLNLAGLTEEAFYWRDETTGILCKCKPDRLVRWNDALVIIDLKSTASADYSKFQRDAFNFGYHVSAEFYRQGVRAVLGEEVQHFIVMAYEKESPFACAFYEFDSEALTAARQEISRLLDQLAECEHRNEFPGYPQTIQSLSLPAWRR